MFPTRYSAYPLPTVPPDQLHFVAHTAPSRQRSAPPLLGLLYMSILVPRFVIFNASNMIIVRVVVVFVCSCKMMLFPLATRLGSFRGGNVATSGCAFAL